MTKEPFIAHSEMTDEIYIVCGTKKYLVTEQVIKAMQNTGRLEQQPSDDCVSRTEMLKYQQYLRGKMSNEENHKLWEFIKALPPVTPTHKVGKWIYHFERDDYNDYEDEYYECPFCHDLGGDKYYHYCPICGNKVKGVEDGSN